MRRHDFNPRTPVGCDPWPARPASADEHYFNPRTPVGCDSLTLRVGETASLFQSTHPSGVRPDTGHVPSASRYFNPRTPVGCDFRSAAVHGELELISIHAPQWGATIAPIPTESSACHFNPRTPVGCDKIFWRYTQNIWQFQSTHPSGVRPSVILSSILWIYFNPRTPVGCDAHRLSNVSLMTLFQSTHPSGVRQVMKK